MDFTANLIFEMFQRDEKIMIRMNLNNETQKVFGKDNSSEIELEQFLEILRKNKDENFAKNCGIEKFIEKSDIKIYAICLFLSLLILAGLVGFYFYLIKKEKEKELQQSINEERLIL